MISCKKFRVACPCCCNSTAFTVANHLPFLLHTNCPSCCRSTALTVAHQLPLLLQGSNSHSKRRKKSTSAQDSDSDLEIAGFFTDEEADSDSGSDEEDEDMDECAIRRTLPGTVEGLEQEAATLTVDLNEKVEKVRELKGQQT